MRQVRGRETMKEIKEGLDSKLGVGLKEIEDALNRIEATKTMNAVTLLVTTRTMGFCAAQIYFHCSKQRNPVYCDIYAFYRINLAMFEAKLYYIRRNQELPTLNFQDIYDVPYRPEYLGVTSTITALPDQVARVLKALGPVHEGNEYFVPALAADQRTRQGRLIPQSERVAFSNLRQLWHWPTQPQTLKFVKHSMLTIRFREPSGE